jgi:hypothetical protein
MKSKKRRNAVPNRNGFEILGKIKIKSTLSQTLFHRDKTIEVFLVFLFWKDLVVAMQNEIRTLSYFLMM